ncbi:unnamed protein product [Prorocentrum cordatum]|uniref:Uncharacterized protein n=1 Tax=Prorocentrum cordatum TaxID=2364126 RepID=A0ABN9XWC8_9DINO|nr:unnamed protein product [Polarella glacialis]
MASRGVGAVDVRMSYLADLPYAQAAFGAFLAAAGPALGPKATTALVAAAARGAAQGAAAGSRPCAGAGGDDQDPVGDMDVVLAKVKAVSGHAGELNVTDAKRWLRAHGERGSNAAARLGKLSKLRNTQSHPLALQLIVEVGQLAAAVGKEELKKGDGSGCHKGAEAGPAPPPARRKSRAAPAGRGGDCMQPEEADLSETVDDITVLASVSEATATGPEEKFSAKPAKLNRELIQVDIKLAPDVEAKRVLKVRDSDDMSETVSSSEQEVAGPEEKFSMKPVAKQYGERIQKDIRDAPACDYLDWKYQLKSAKIDELVKVCLSREEFEEKLQAWEDNL